MERFSVSLSGVQAGASGLGDVAKALKNISTALNGVGVSKHSLRAQTRLSQARQELLNEQTKVNQIAMSLNGISGLYKQAEEKIVSGRKEALVYQTIDLAAHNILNFLEDWKEEEYCFSVLSPGIIGAVLLSETSEGASSVGASIEQDEGIEFLGYEWEFGKAKKKWKLFAKNKDSKWRDKFGDYFDLKYSTDNEENKLKLVTEEEDSKQEKKDKKISKKNVAESITIASFRHSFIDEDEQGVVLCDNDVGKITLGKRDFYIGNKLTAGSLEAGIGGSFSVLSLELKEGQIGNDMLGVHTSVNADILSASGNAKFGAGWINEDGKIDPHLYGELSAEVVAAKVSGEVGLDILGADVDLKGSVGVGFGFHAKAGIDDGVLTLDIGGYLGIGGDVSLELDLSKPVENIVEFTSDAISVISDVGSDVLESVGNVVGDVGDAIGNSIQKAGEFLSDGWKKLKFW